MIADRVLINFQLHKLIRDDRRPSQKTKFFVSRDALRDASRWLAIIADGILTAFSYVGNVAKHTSATIADASRHMRTRLNHCIFVLSWEYDFATLQTEYAIVKANSVFSIVFTCS